MLKKCEKQLFYVLFDAELKNPINFSIIPGGILEKVQKFINI